MSDIDTAPMESLIALDPNRPIREADIHLAHEVGAKRVDIRGRQLNTRFRRPIIDVAFCHDGRGLQPLTNIQRLRKTSIISERVFRTAT